MIKTYKGYEYIAHWFEEQGHFCGYVRLPDNHKLIGLIGVYGVDLSVGYNDIDVSCHGGLTFGDIINGGEGFKQGFSKGTWIGWDYAHLDDKTAYNDGIEHTANEVEEECKSVIDQLIKLNK